MYTMTAIEILKNVYKLDEKSIQLARGGGNPFTAALADLDVLIAQKRAELPPELPSLATNDDLFKLIDLLEEARELCNLRAFLMRGIAAAAELAHHG